MSTKFTELQYAIEEAEWLYEQTKQPQHIYAGKFDISYYVNPEDTSGLLLVETIGIGEES